MRQQQYATAAAMQALGHGRSHNQAFPTPDPAPHAAYSHGLAAGALPPASPAEAAAEAAAMALFRVDIYHRPRSSAALRHPLLGSFDIPLVRAVSYASYLMLSDPSLTMPDSSLTLSDPSHRTCFGTCCRSCRGCCARPARRSRARNAPAGAGGSC